MSAAQSDLDVALAHEKAEHPSGISTPHHQAQAGQALEELLAQFEHTHEPVIAVDMDDVLSQTNHVVAQCESIVTDYFDELTEHLAAGHNEAYGTNMGLEHFYCAWNLCIL